VSEALLATRIRIPHLRSGTVPRARLTERLERSADVRLVLVSAPAGFGKTTLLVDWLSSVRAASGAVAWLSLDARDSVPVDFWRHLVASVGSAAPGAGAGAATLLGSAAVPLDTVVSSLLADLDSLPQDLVLVLDDYHVIESAEIDASLESLVAHLPAHVRLVLATRSDPGFPLARYRARGQLLEVRAADLRFSPDEADAYLNGAMGLALASADLAALEARTEGWIAALQLAALSIQGRADASAFIAGFAGDDRYIVDYLAEEVLERLPVETRRFVLRTSILDRLTGSLCDELTGQDDGRATLVSLDRRNLFLVPLDDRRQWYRYHHLFADVLRAHLADESPELVPELHRAASRWFDRAGEPAEAIRHALAARDFPRAADLIELASPGLQQARQEVAIRDWILALPEDIVRTRPVLSNTFAGALLSTGRFDLAERPLVDAERLAELASASSAAPGHSPDLVVVDEFQAQRLPAYTAVHRAGYSLVTGDMDRAVDSARRALALSTPEDHIVRAAAAALIGLVTWTRGELTVAADAYDGCLIDMRKAHHFSDVLGCCIALADIQITLGRLDRAKDAYDSGLRLAGEQEGPPLRGSGDMLVGLSEVSAERGELPEAMDHLNRALQLGDAAGLPQYPYRRRVALARIRESEGDLAGSLALLEDARAVFTTDFSPDVHPIPALTAALHVRMGATSEAVRWALASGLSVDDDLDYVREFEHITLARILLARHAEDRAVGSLPDAMRLLERLLRAAEAGDRTASAIEIRILRSVAFEAAGQHDRATESLLEAAEAAAPQGYLRLFTKEGAHLGPLLADAARRSPRSTFVRRLLGDAQSTPAPRGSAAQLVDPLSEREMDVLRLLSTELDGPAIARELYVSLNTVRTHTRSIYTKLQVTNRRAAVRRARELELLP
jgi:LuxR family transcriptional regulator, maltose regulon positive regulatory protein